MFKVAFNAAVKCKFAVTLKNATLHQKNSCKSFCVVQDAFTAPLPFKALPFNSVELDAETLPVQDTSEFGSRLYSTLEKCKTVGIKSIFLRVPMLYSHYIPVAGSEQRYLHLTASELFWKLEMTLYPFVRGSASVYLNCLRHQRLVSD